MRAQRTGDSGQGTVRRRNVATALVVLGVAVLSACSSIQRDPPIMIWWDMKRQAKFRTEGETGLFADGRNTRQPVEDTVARGQLVDDSSMNTGMEGPMYVGKSPVPVTPALLKQGQARFNVYCAPCHDGIGDGHGIVPTKVPTWQPANLTEDRVVELADGDIFNVITNGRRTMPAYKYQIVTADRWAIVAYVRVLQRAAHGTMEDVPAERRAELK